MPPILEVRDLHKRYGDHIALHQVSFHVNEGEMFGLLGPNGAGKTTTLSIISCLLQATGGEVRIQDKVVRPDDKDIRRVIGIVPQELALYEELTALENLLFFGRLYGIDEVTLKRRVYSLLEAVGLSDRAHSRVQTFSGGMKRRLNLGASLVHAPRLLLLDEPTTGVDPQSRNHIFEEVRRLNREGVAVVYTSHYMEEVEALCTRIGIIDHGRLVACDTLPNLLQLMHSSIQFRVAGANGDLIERVRKLPNATLNQTDDTLELECKDVKSTLLKLVSLLNEMKVELTHLETRETNLERVFLHLTGRALRD